jgi:hypothetical protein
MRSHRRWADRSIAENHALDDAKAVSLRIHHAARALQVWRYEIAKRDAQPTRKVRKCVEAGSDLS